MSRNLHPNIEALRRYYVNIRKVTGCPPIIALRLKPIHWGWYVETKDGKVHIEQCETFSVRDAKAQCVEEWNRLKEKENGK